MKAIQKQAADILRALIADLEVGQARRIGGPRGGPIMPVSVECIGNDLFSVAHYYEQHGDLMADPEMVFLRQGPEFFPVHFQQDNLGIFRRGLVLDEENRLIQLNRHEQSDQADFAGQWMINIREQQAAWFENPRVRFQVLSPDGIPIAPRTYDDETDARLALCEWIERFVMQGYYAGARERIPVTELAARCAIVSERV